MLDQSYGDYGAPLSETARNIEQREALAEKTGPIGLIDVAALGALVFGALIGLI